MSIIVNYYNKEIVNKYKDDDVNKYNRQFSIAIYYQKRKLFISIFNDDNINLVNIIKNANIEKKLFKEYVLGKFSATQKEEKCDMNNI